MPRDSLVPPAWHFHRRLSEGELQPVCDALSVSPLVAQILHNRALSLTEAQTMLDEPCSNNSGHDPFLFADMARAVERIQLALKRSEKVTIYGDYDVDGICGTAILVEGLSSLGIQVVPYIPHRSREGYGLHTAAIDSIHATGSTLIITVDCGVMGREEVEHARHLGMDVIITDHHRAPHNNVFPQAAAVIHSKHGSYPNHDLTGAGVAWKLLVAVERALGTSLASDSKLDLVALGAVCDITPLRGENRLLVRQGLRLLSSDTCRTGVRAMLNAARINRMDISAHTIGYTLGPRLNAASRMDDPITAYRLITCREQADAALLADILETLNASRQTLVRGLEDAIQAELNIQPENCPPLIWVDRADIPVGVAGLIAGNLSNRYYRPAVVLEHNETESRGSARSIPEVDIMEALKSCEHLLVRYGGHSSAAGMTVRNENLPLLCAHLSRACALQMRGTPQPRLVIDAKVRLSSVTWTLHRMLQRLEPFGHGNEEPVFASLGVRVTRASLIGSNKHLSLTLNDGNGTTLSAIGWQMAESLRVTPPGSYIDVAYTVEENNYNGDTSLRLKLKAIRKSV